MDIWSIAIGLLGGFGIGSIINTIINYKAQKERFKFETIYKKRVEILSELYKKIDKTERLFGSLMAPFQEAGDFTPEEKLKQAVKAANEFLEYFCENRIYLNESIEEKVDVVSKEFKQVWITFKYATFEKNRYDIKKWQEVWHKVKDDIPIINKEIKEKFREIMGIK